MSLTRSVTSTLLPLLRCCRQRSDVACKASIQQSLLILNEKKAQNIINTKFKGATIEQMAQSAGVGVQKADSVSFAQPFIPNIGNEPKMAGAAFNKSLQGKVSEPIAGNTGVFVIKGEDSCPAKHQYQCRGTT